MVKSKWSRMRINVEHEPRRILVLFFPPLKCWSFDRVIQSLVLLERRGEDRCFDLVIRFVESSSTNVSGDDDPSDSILLCQLNTATDSRSSSRTSTDNPYPVQSFDSLPTANEVPTNNNNTINKPEASKGSCFLETPPPSLPDIHLTQDSESPPANLQQQFKSKRKQDRPQRKALPKEKTLDEQEEEEEVLPVRGTTTTTTTTTDAGYLSDEYSEPIRSDQMDLEEFARRLTTSTSTSSSSSFVLSGEKKIFYEEFHSFISKNVEHYQQLDDYRRETYPDVNGNSRLSLISQILKELFSIGYQRDLNDLVEFIPEEIHKHFQLCFTHLRQAKKKLPQRVKRVTGHLRQAKTKKSLDPPIEQQQQQMLLSPASPVTEELLSPNTTTTIAELTVLPKERDVYEIIHCLCQCEVDNGFMIQVRISTIERRRESLCSFSVKPVCVGHIANVLEWHRRVFQPSSNVVFVPKQKVTSLVVVVVNTLLDRRFFA